MIDLLAALVLTWSMPTEREDGTPIGEGEIIGFEMFRDGEPHATVEGNVLELEVNQDGDYTVRAIDSDYRVSEHSNVVGVTIKEKVKPPGLAKQRHKHWQ